MYQWVLYKCRGGRYRNDNISNLQYMYCTSLISLGSTSWHSTRMINPYYALNCHTSCKVLNHCRYKTTVLQSAYTRSTLACTIHTCKYTVSTTRFILKHVVCCGGAQMYMNNADHNGLQYMLLLNCFKQWICSRVMCREIHVITFSITE